MEKQPQISSQVIVQSEKEKQLLKQVRKEEKKLQRVASKLESGRGIDDDEDEEIFNPIELRLKRQEALTAKAEPLFKKNRIIAPTFVRENYPFVFDSKLNVKSAAGNYFFTNSLI